MINRRTYDLITSDRSVPIDDPGQQIHLVESDRIDQLCRPGNLVEASVPLIVGHRL